MSNTLYDSGREAFLKGDIDWLQDTIRVALTSGYVAKTTGTLSEKVFSDVGSSKILKTQILQRQGNLGHATNGVAGGSDITFTEVTGSVTGILIYKDTGNPTTSTLIAFLDDVTGLNYTASSDTITIQWDRGVNKIFKL